LKLKILKYEGRLTVEPSLSYIEGHSFSLVMIREFRFTNMCPYVYQMLLVNVYVRRCVRQYNPS